MRCSCRPIACSRCSTARSWTGRCIAFRCSGSSRCRSGGRVGQCARRDRRPRRVGRRQERAGVDPHVGRAARDPSGGRDGRVGAERGAGAVLRGDRRRVAGQPRAATRCRSTLRNRLRLAATHAVRTSADVVRAMYDLAGGSAIYDGSPLQRRFRDAFTATAHFQVNEASRELPGRILLDQPADVCDAVTDVSKSSCRSGWTGPTRRRSTSRWRPSETGSTRCGSARWPPTTPSRWPPRSDCVPGLHAEDRTAGGRCAQPGHAGVGRQLGRLAHRQPRRPRVRRLQPGDRVGLARPPVGAPRGAHARNHRVPTPDAWSARASTTPAGTSAATASGCATPCPDTRIAVGAFGPAMTRVGGAGMPMRSCSILFHRPGRRGAGASSTPRPLRPAAPRPA